ncbi:MAG: MurT ligase domain-containing protein [Patescibacteria group bacterium]
MRFYIALYAAKITNFCINFFNLGAGYTWPGHVALKIYPKILQNPRIQFSNGIVLVTGTNGKTTTSKLIRSILARAKVTFTHNLTGANLLNGIVSATLLNMSLTGKQQAKLGLFEVDEFTLPVVLNQLHPSILVLLNLSRDQLDRYGEVDIIIQRWEKALQKLNSTTQVVYDENQPHIETLVKVSNLNAHSFNSNETNLSYTHLYGSFNARNANAAFIAASLLKINEQDIIDGLKSFRPAYGRGEVLSKNHTDFQIFLAKNPASFNSNLDMLLQGKLAFDSILYVLNDEVRDGRDVSWIYDINPNKLKKCSADVSVFVAGTRALDMAVRLKYAGVNVPSSNIFDSLTNAVSLLSSNEALSKIICFPNYSAMLSLRKELKGREIL